MLLHIHGIQTEDKDGAGRKTNSTAGRALSTEIKRGIKRRQTDIEEVEEMEREGKWEEGAEEEKEEEGDKNGSGKSRKGEENEGREKRGMRDGGMGERTRDKNREREMCVCCSMSRLKPEPPCSISHSVGPDASALKDTHTHTVTHVDTHRLSSFSISNSQTHVAAISQSCTQINKDAQTHSHSC